MPNPRILIIDDSNISRRTIGYLLKQFEYDLYYANSGEDAIARFDAINPDIVLLDVIMPEMDGFDVCRYLRSKTKWQHIPIILLTALSSTDDVVEGLEAGADEFLPKPINGDVLRAYITSILRRQQKLDALKAKMQERENLAAMIVHDMRNPLAAMQINSQLLELKMNGSDNCKYIERIQSQTRYLQGFTNDLLTIASAEESTLVIKREAIDFVALIESALQEHQPSANLRHINLVSSLPEFAPMVRVDPNLIRRLLDNLLQNAFKFSPPESTVTVSIEFSNDEEKSFALRVSDEGCGIAPAYRERVFEKYEIGKLQSAGVQQTGLGLAFCKMVAEGHNGCIYVTDNLNNKGARFVVEI